MSDPLARPQWRGRTNIDALTIAAIEYAEELAGKTFVVTQGSYNTSVDASAGTHAGGGAVDLRWTWDDADILALRRAGFAAWHRTPAQGGWPHHIHAVLVDHPALSPAAARQVQAYRDGRNGLANNGPDDGPRLNPIPVFTLEDDMSWDTELAKWDPKDGSDGKRPAGMQLNQARGYAEAAFEEARKAANRAGRLEKAVEALGAALGPEVEAAVRAALADAVVDVDVTVHGGD